MSMTILRHSVPGYAGTDVRLPWPAQKWLLPFAALRQQDQDFALACLDQALADGCPLHALSGLLLRDESSLWPAWKARHPEASVALAQCPYSEKPLVVAAIQGREGGLLEYLSGQGLEKDALAPWPRDYWPVSSDANAPWFLAALARGEFDAAETAWDDAAPWPAALCQRAMEALVYLGARAFPGREVPEGLATWWLRLTARGARPEAPLVLQSRRPLHPHTHPLLFAECSAWYLAGEPASRLPLDHIEPPTHWSPHVSSGSVYACPVRWRLGEWTTSPAHRLMELLANAKVPQTPEWEAVLSTLHPAAEAKDGLGRTPLAAGISSVSRSDVGRMSPCCNWVLSSCPLAAVERGDLWDPALMLLSALDLRLSSLPQVVDAWTRWGVEEFPVAPLLRWLKGMAPYTWQQWPEWHGTAQQFSRFLPAAARPQWEAVLVDVGVLVKDEKPDEWKVWEEIKPRLHQCLDTALLVAATPAAPALPRSRL